MISPQKGALYGCGTQKKIERQLRALMKTSSDNYCRGVTLVEYQRKKPSFRCTLSCATMGLA
jgi:hypothetical protein